MQAHIPALSWARRGDAAIVSADVEAAYGKVVKVIDILKTSGIERFAVQIEHEEKK